MLLEGGWGGDDSESIICVCGVRPTRVLMEYNIIRHERTMGYNIIYTSCISIGGKTAVKLNSREKKTLLFFVSSKKKMGLM